MNRIDQKIKGLRMQRDLVSKKKDIAEHAKKHGGSGSWTLILLIVAVIIALVSSTMLATMMSNPVLQDKRKS
jgi:flagellar basal body-associated protein FliL